MRMILFFFLIAFSLPALAHDPVSADRQEQLAGYISVFLLGSFWLMYLIGARQKPSRLNLMAIFHATFFLCAFAVFGPLDEWAETSTAAHMGQHMIFMVVIAPLFVLSQPLPQLLAGGGRIGIRLLKPLLRLARRPMLAAYIHGAVIWFWHMPYFYTLALTNPWWHIVEHACFLLSASLFWWAVLKGNRRRAPWALLALLLTLMHTGFLGALLSFAQGPLYGDARSLADQQLAGLIMWVAGALPYLAAALSVIWVGWLEPERERRAIHLMRIYAKILGPLSSD